MNKVHWWLRASLTETERDMQSVSQLFWECRTFLCMGAFLLWNISIHIGRAPVKRMCSCTSCFSEHLLVNNCMARGVRTWPETAVDRYCRTDCWEVRLRISSWDSFERNFKIRVCIFGVVWSWVNTQAVYKQWRMNYKRHLWAGLCDLQPVKPTSGLNGHNAPSKP